MTLMNGEMEKIRLHVGIHSGYKRIERRKNRELVGARRYEDRLKPMPKCVKATKTAGKVFDYLAAPLLHDLNRMAMMLNIWEEQLDPVPNRELKGLIQTMELWITSHGGRP